MKTAEGLCKRTLGEDYHKKRRECPLTGRKDTLNSAEKERKKNKMKEREGLRIWDLAWSNQMRIQILEDSSSIVNFVNRRWKIHNQKFRPMVQKTQKMLDRTDIRPVEDHLDMFQHVSRDNGIRTLIISRMWQEEKGRHGIPT